MFYLFQGRLSQEESDLEEELQSIAKDVENGDLQIRPLTISHETESGKYQQIFFVL